MTTTTLKAIHLTRQELRVLGDALDAKESGYSRHDVRRLDRVQAKIEETLGAFGTRIALLARQAEIDAREIRAEGFRDDGAARIGYLNARLNDQIEELVETLGAEEVDLLLEADELQFVQQAFGAIDKWRGAKQIRRWMLAIDRALDKENVRDVPVGPVAATPNGHADDKALAHAGVATYPVRKGKRD